MRTPLPASATHLEHPDAQSVAAAYAQLLRQPADEALLREWSRVRARVVDAGSLAEIARHLDSSDSTAHDRVRSFESEVRPALERGDAALAARFDASAVPVAFQGLVAAHASEPMGDDPALRARDVELVGQYMQRVQQVDFAGERNEVYGAMSSPDRARRQWGTERHAAGHCGVFDAADALVSELVEVRVERARSAGLPSFEALMFRQYRRRWLPADVVQFRERVRQQVVPVLTELEARCAREHGLDALAPWDPPPPAGTAPTGAALLDLVDRMMHDLDDELGAVYRQLRPDIDHGDGPGRLREDFATVLLAERRTRVFLSMQGRWSDLFTALHEVGHAQHFALLTAAHPWLVTLPTIEIAELASMAHELLHLHHLELALGDAAPSARRAQLRKMLTTVCNMALSDAWQAYVWGTPGHTPADRRAVWRELWQTYRPSRDWTVVPHWEAERVGYLGQVARPFYAIEYGFCGLGAVQIAQRQADDPAGALGAYKRFLRADPHRGPGELFEMAGASFPPQAESMAAAMDWVLAQ